MLRVGVIFKIISTLLLGSVIIACDLTANNTNLAEVGNENTNQTKANINLIYKKIIDKAKLNFLIIPVAISPDPNSQDGLPLLSSKRSSKANNIYNLVFYNKTNNKSHILLDKKAIIKSFDLLETQPLPRENTPAPQEDSAATNKYWLYRIIEKDTNRDGKLSVEDAVIGYISSGDGKNLVQVTPDNTQIQSWKVISQMNAILILVKFDTDNDKIFGNRDRISYIRVNLDKLEKGQEMIDREIEQKIKSILEK